MHKQVKQFCKSVKHRFPLYFSNTDVLDCGSMDINGNNRYLFDHCRYTGIDIASGKNVDIVTPVHLFKPNHLYGVVISTEMFEHDVHYLKSLRNMFNLTISCGLLLITSAGVDRPEHGTFQHHPADSPLTPHYYRNVTVEMLLQALDLNQFSWYELSYCNTDIRFAGIKR